MVYKSGGCDDDSRHHHLYMVSSSSVVLSHHSDDLRRLILCKNHAVFLGNLNNFVYLIDFSLVELICYQNMDPQSWKIIFYMINFNFGFYFVANTLFVIRARRFYMTNWFGCRKLPLHQLPKNYVLRILVHCCFFFVLLFDSFVCVRRCCWVRVGRCVRDCGRLLMDEFPRMRCKDGYDDAQFSLIAGQSRYFAVKCYTNSRQVYIGWAKTSNQWRRLHIRKTQIVLCTTLRKHVAWYLGVTCWMTLVIEADDS